MQKLCTLWSYSYLAIFCYNQFNIFEFAFKCFALCTLLLNSRKKLELDHDILQVVLDWYDKNFNPVFYVEKFIREFGCKGVQQASVDPINTC